jgi:hypothetical protein
MNDSEKKDKILAFLNIEDNREGVYYFQGLNDDVFNDSPLSESNLEYLVECILRDGYATGNVQAFQYDASITSFLKSGGYTGQDARRKTESEYQEKIKKKTIQEGILVNWQTKTFWFVLAMAVIGAIVGVIVFFRK